MAVTPNLMPAGGYGAALAQMAPTAPMAPLQGAQLPTAQGAPASNVPGQGAVGAWKGFLQKVQSDPAARLALLQAGAIMLRPGYRGQSELSKIADGVLGGMSSYYQLDAVREEAERKKLEEERKLKEEEEKLQYQREEDRKKYELDVRKANELKEYRKALVEARKGRSGGGGGKALTAKDRLAMEGQIEKLASLRFPEPDAPDTFLLPREERAVAEEEYKARKEEWKRSKEEETKRLRAMYGLEEGVVEPQGVAPPVEGAPRTVTIEQQGKFFVFPAMLDGKALGEDDVVRAVMAGKLEPVGVFDTREEAEAFGKGPAPLDRGEKVSNEEARSLEMQMMDASPNKEAYVQNVVKLYQERNKGRLSEDTVKRVAMLAGARWEEEEAKREEPRSAREAYLKWRPGGPRSLGERDRGLEEEYRIMVGKDPAEISKEEVRDFFKRVQEEWRKDRENEKLTRMLEWARKISRSK